MLEQSRGNLGQFHETNQETPKTKGICSKQVYFSLTTTSLLSTRFSFMSDNQVYLCTCYSSMVSLCCYHAPQNCIPKPTLGDINKDIYVDFYFLHCSIRAGTKDEWHWMEPDRTPVAA